MNARERERFDGLVEEAIESLPPALADWLGEIPVLVEDIPSAEILRDLGYPPDDADAIQDLCGLHSGVSDTDRSVEHSGELPSRVHLFRVGIINAAGGWAGDGVEDAVYDQIMITLLHELGHQAGLDEDDLDDLGYG